MEALIWMGIGGSGFGALIILRLVAKHGWSWVQTQLKTHADQTEADFKARISAAAGDLVPRITALEGRVKAALEGDLVKVKEDVAALQAKVPH